MKNTQKAFTLAELLMVIGIIAFLGAVTLIAARETRERARIAKGLNFSGQIYHALGAYAVGIWSFNEGSGSNVADSSGRMNNGTWQGTGGNHWADHDVPLLKNALIKAGQFNGDVYQDTVVVQDSDSLDGFLAMTIEGWVKMKTDCSILPYYFIYKEGSYEGFCTANKIIFRFGDADNNLWSLTSSIDISPNKWYHFAATYSGTSPQVKTKLYIDGKEVFNQIQDITKDSPLYDDEGSLYLGKGCSYMLCFYFNGFLDEIRIYEDSLSSVQIKKLYAEGLKRHLTITRE